MFTGLIEATGRVRAVSDSGGGRRLSIAAPFAAEIAAGDSVAVNGVCLTAVRLEGGSFEADVSPETLRVTTIGRLETGTLVNLERPLRADARLGGHFVLGHVDGVARVIALDPDGDSYRFAIDLPPALAPYVILKGSIAIDGVSLTVASLDRTVVGIQIVPFTHAHTALGVTRAGDAVNVEVDMLGKYVVRLLEARADAAAGAIHPLGISV